MTMLPTFLAGANWVMHSAGWLEGGLVAGYEKFIVDVEILQMLQAEFTPLEIDEASLAFDDSIPAISRMLRRTSRTRWSTVSSSRRRCLTRSP